MPVNKYLSMKNDSSHAVKPKQQLGLADAISIIVGIVIGAGIFRTPSLVAANTENTITFFLTWIVGGAVSIIGALCYAELTTTFPNTGGDYHFIMRAYGKRSAFLFAWARMSIIQTGSIALLAFIFGDYFTRIFSLGDYSSVIYAALVVILLTSINIAGISFGVGTQKLFTLAEIGGAMMIVVAGLFFAPAQMEKTTELSGSTGSQDSFIGMAMVFVLLTFGGWNEAAYISAELKPGRKRMVKALILSLIIITAVYLLINLAYIKALGHSGMAKSEAVGVDLMKLAWGPTGVGLIGIVVAISALTSANATIFTGARTNYALGRDFKVFSALGKWNNQVSGPVNAFVIQGILSLALISLGLITRSGFETIVEYTAPVFWFFFLLVGIALFVLRKKEPDADRPFRVPFYPVTPIIFCLSSAYLLFSSLMYVRTGALVGIAVLLVGVLVLIISQKNERSIFIKQTNRLKAEP
jgi:basic amino acid/polyamine antiporter, APA family